MKTLLRIDASIRLDGSNTRKLTSYFEESWVRENPGGHVVRRCLATDPIPHLTQTAIESFHNYSEHMPAKTLLDTLINELKCADHLLIGSPLYNLNLPSSLKAYFDHVVRSGVTFGVDNGEYRGLLRGKSATLITSRASYRSPDICDDFQKDYLKQILSFIGITDIETVALEGMEEDQTSRISALNRATQEIDHLFAPPIPTAWNGEFSKEDKQEINDLRAGQANAITNGDAAAYAALCTEDIQLLIPAMDLVVGQKAFLQAEQSLFKNTRFKSFRKIPTMIQRSGDLAIEVGRQKVTMCARSNEQDVRFSNQKYTHVFRRTRNGWRVALLMSNESD